MICIKCNEATAGPTGLCNECFLANKASVIGEQRHLGEIIMEEIPLKYDLAKQEFINPMPEESRPSNQMIVQDILDIIEKIKLSGDAPDCIAIMLETWDHLHAAEALIELTSNRAMRIEWVAILRKIVGENMPKNKIGHAIVSDLDLLFCTLDQRRRAFLAIVAKVNEANAKKNAERRLSK